jgi:transcriptional regulator with XRE-family HTH domain
MSADRQEAENLGQQLRDAREAREMSLEDVEQALRIRVRFLAAFESGAYDDLPGAVQARGFLRNYARLLNLDEDSVLARFDAIGTRSRDGWPWNQTQAAARGPVSVADVPAARSTGEFTAVAPRRSPLRMVLTVGLSLLLVGALCGGGVVVLNQVLSEQAESGGTSLQSVLPTAPTLTPSLTFMPSVTPLPGQAVAAGPVITDRVVLDLTIVQRTFLRVTADGTLLFEGMVTPGTTLPYQAQTEIVLEASNAAGVEALFNNLTLGPLGGRGEAVTRAFTPDLALTPTALPQPTATPEPAEGAVFPAGEGPTALPVPDGAAAGGAPGPTPLPIPGVPTATPAGEQAGGGLEAGGEAVSATLPGGLPPTTEPLPEQPSPMPSATWTPSPTLTVTPSPTMTPSPTPVLPPRQTSTPVPEKS